MSVERRLIETAGVRERITLYLARLGGGRSIRVVPLTGDASDRRYFRLIEADSPSTVLAVHSGPFAIRTLPFANVADLFQRMPVWIPAILDHQDDLGILLLEDLGDVTLQAHLGAAPATDHAPLYREAVDLIARIQSRGAALFSPDHIAYKTAFDVDKLTWELEFFVKYFIEAYRGVSVAGPARETLAEEWAAMVAELVSEPRVLCHRDYHSRNLMLHRQRLYIIDFQDARMGPDTYDLASLLRDAYVDVSEQSVDELIAYFLELKGISDSTEQTEFRRRFDLMAAQRTLKALGTFGYQTTVRGNPVYIQYIPRTLRNIRNTLEKYSRFARLHELLAEHIEELR